MDFFKKITIGRYLDTGSLVHRLDPRTKLITLIAVSVVTFYSVKPNKFGMITLGALFILSILVIVLSRISIRYVVKCILKFLWFFLFIMIFHSFFTPGKVLFEYRGIVVTHEGLNNAGMMITKLFIVIQCTYIFILTTSPLEITNGTKKLFSFLKIIKVPVEDIAVMVTLAIRFIPTFFIEIRKIMDAQRARGVVFREGSVKKRIKAISLIVTPIFYNTFKRADELNTAMVSRGYRVGAKRSSYKRIRLAAVDYLVLAALVLFVAAVAAF
jgi:energy-coupling factor transport system permease protein